MSSTFSHNSVTSVKSVVKPSIAPPPPPPSVIKPSTAPPPPPIARNNEDDIVKPLEEFKIDLNTQSDIPKTGFDFLDNW